MNGNAAVEWVNTNVVPYAKDVNIGWIAVGNELVSADPAAALITQAMGNILNALNAAQLTGIHVSTAISGRVLGVTYPPSAGDFNNESKEIMIAIIKWLQTINSPLFINVYPYFAFASSPTDIPLNYALFNATNPVIDGPYTYTSLFDAMVDSFYAALDKNGGENLAVVVSETGWPTAGFEPYTSIQNAQTYNQKLIDKVKATGTPRRPSALLDCFIFAMFNEDQKGEGVEQNWGLHYPNASPVYPLTF
ncbi:lichenase-2-like [Chenopodium quinoa]|uniref:lichenase-2-like n=1 Tax=Chenopodium quinoa TaxID=63459 RepID=UPI000B78BFF3|nr:lichenase-2-like [Chenopodium quinoa]